MRKKDFLITSIITHRGIHNTFLENTILAFEKAIQKQMTIELDVQLTKDNVAIVFHDNNLKRIFGINREIKDLNLTDIKKYQYIPTLEEVLDLVQGKVPLLIELKLDTSIGVLEKTVCNLLDHYQGQFAIQSFNPLSILWFRLNRPHYIRGYLIHSLLPDSFLLRFFLNCKLVKKVLKPDFIGVNLSALKLKQIQKLRQKYFIIGYTLKTKKEYLEYYSYADNFICDINKETVPLRTASQKE